ncbi:unnamed protein product [Allacma fusca]|uniref:Uncharacterized protein n=1 Tax=Allacma fusca TaxID=39272 RepID=A0A8J2JX70_9HEXA|nr:unnamed protein product [Allacma fusca]
MSINNNINKNIPEPKKTSSETSQEPNRPGTSLSATQISQTLPGLEPLDQTDQLYIVKRNEIFPFNLGVPIRSHFHIYNNNGQHVFSACQTDPRFRERKFVMYIYNVTNPQVEDPFLKILQRCPERPEETDKVEVLPYKKLDEELTQLNSRRAGPSGKSRPYRDVRGHIHIRHVDQDFLGHIWRGKTEFRAFNANLQQLFTFPKEPPRTVAKASQGPEQRKKLSFFSNKWIFYDYFLSGSSEPFLPQIPLGRVQLNADPRNVGIIADKKNCCSLTFPFDFSSVEKCLVLTFALSMYCRTKSTSETIHQRCLFFILGVSTLVVLVILIVGTVCELAESSRCKVFEI